MKRVLLGQAESLNSLFTRQRYSSKVAFVHSSDAVASLCSAEQLSPGLPLPRGTCGLTCSHPSCSLASRIPHLRITSPWRSQDPHKDPCLYLHSRPPNLSDHKHTIRICLLSWDEGHSIQIKDTTC